MSSHRVMFEKECWDNITFSVNSTEMDGVRKIVSETGSED